MGRQLFGRNVGLLAAFLLAINGFHIRYSQEARSYSLYVFLVVLSCWFYIRSADDPSRQIYCIGLVAASVLAIYAHFFAVLILPVFWFAAIVVRRPSFPWKRLLASTAGICAGGLPLFLFALLKNQGQRNWISR